MNPERWKRVKQLLDEAIPLGPGQRPEFLDAACDGDAELKREVVSLLSSHERAGTGFLGRPAVDLRSGYVPAPRVGRRIGAYEILEQIGHGGMGEVYRASRADGQYEKEVAIKLVRGGYDTAAVLERFRHERQILASLDHPNIARLLDGGTTEEGIPYLVMELIEGTPIDEYCDVQKLNVTQRLRLLLQVCSAVQYAHQRLVIHRDIKPGNILVTKEGIPKLLDFGIAKILAPGVNSETTIAGPMTPEYASPEQIQGEPITTATDVYSSGVVLYRLLTGRSPYSTNTRTPHELARVICEHEPERPSTAVLRPIMRAEGASSAPTPESVSNVREGSPAKLCRRLSGDLDTIVLRAMHKEPRRRYVSVEQFADDIRRHLEGLPVTARRDSWQYRAGKFAVRHKLGMAASAIVLVAVAAGVAATIREARIAAANQRRAEKRFNDVRSLAHSLMYEIHGSVENLPGAAAARQLIVQRSKEYLDSLAKEATGDVSLQRELASAYERLGTIQGGMYESSIGDAEAARKSLGKAVAIREAIAASNPENSDDQIALVRAYEQLGRAQWLSPGGSHEGWQNLKRAVAIAEAQARGYRSNAILEALARGYQYIGDLEGGSGLRGGTGDLADALQNHRKALPLLKEIADASPSDPYKRYLLARAMLGVGDDYLHQGDAAQALDYYQQTQKIVEPLARNANNPLYTRGLAICHTRIGDALLMSGLPAEALAHYRKEEEVLQPLAAADPRDTAAQLTLVTSEGDIGHAMVESGRVEQGTAVLQHALSETVRVTRTANDSYARTLLASTNALLGEALERGGKAGAARPYYVKALEFYSAAASADPADLEDAVNVVIMRNHLGRAELKAGDAKAARDDYRNAVDAAEALAASCPDNVEVLYARADSYAGLGGVSAMRARSGLDSSARSASWREAAIWYRKSLSAWQRVPRPGPVSPNGFEAGDPRDVARKAKGAELASGRPL